MSYGLVQFDEKDAAILAKRQVAFDTVSGPRVGDFVRIPGEDGLRRFTHHWGDSIQTTVSPRHPCNGDSSFYFYGEGCSFSGSLDSAIPIECIVDTGETQSGSVWFFHHNEAGAHRGVYCKAMFRVYEYRKAFK
jgi:hypothetical protein